MATSRTIRIHIQSDPYRGKGKKVQGNNDSNGPAMYCIMMTKNLLPANSLNEAEPIIYLGLYIHSSCSLNHNQPWVSIGSSSCLSAWSNSNWLVMLSLGGLWVLLFRLSRLPPRPCCCSGFLPSPPVTAPVLAGLLGIRPMAKLQLQFLGALQHQGK